MGLFDIFKSKNVANNTSDKAGNSNVAESSSNTVAIIERYVSGELTRLEFFNFTY